MRKETILVVDDEPDIRDILNLTLSEQDYNVIEAENGEEALKIIRSKPLDLVLLDYKIPKMDGRQVCQIIKDDILMRHLPVIMLTGKGDIEHRVGGINAGADDYIVKPFEPKELLARIHMVLRRTQRDLEANPLTRLPGNVSILSELSGRMQSGEPFAACYIDLDKFKSYDDKYGFERGDTVIKKTAEILLKAIKEKGNPADFVGHIGGDDFVIVTTPDKVDAACKKIIKDFEAAVPSFYEKEDREKGFIMAKDRKGTVQKIPLLSISIGVVTNKARKISHVGQISEIGAELKSYAKSLERSNYIVDKRVD
ncbi:MAG: response regulator [Candidatus Omnitrophica bacterium]|nr:response regulator [Candidatus Omnitrophota bacterium]